MTKIIPFKTRRELEIDKHVASFRRYLEDNGVDSYIVMGNNTSEKEEGTHILDNADSYADCHIFSSSLNTYVASIINDPE